MKRKMICLCVFLTLLMIGSVSFAQDIPLVPLTPPIDPALINIVGTWNYTASASTVTGMCPAGPPGSGTITISGGAGAYTLVFVSGRVCSPASMCTFTGTLTGNNLLVSNADTVDNEGGSAGNALNLTVHNNGLITGNGSSSYIHPDGFECHWSYTINMTRGTK
ncbi:MAG: hypothetical protein JW765_02325 [Deltaproteobacteria bacterium]|nr:hypothetical protein [Candidatus Zymogenaceae bacterium]